MSEVKNVRWDVETVHDGMHDVGASSVHIESGALVFRDGDGFILVAYGPGFWKAVNEAAQ